MSCPVCFHPRAEEVLRRVRNGEITLKQAAQILGVTYRQLWNHTRFHMGRTKEIRETDVDALEVLQEITKILKGRLEELRHLDISPSNERAIVAVCDSLRKTIMDLERLAGRLQAAPIIQLQKITVHYEYLLQLITSELPKEYQERILKKLEEMPVA